MSTRRHVISLYRGLMREAAKLPSYNIRMYALRKVRDTFRTNKTIGDFEEISRQITVGEQNLELLRRQAIIGHLYTAEKLVIEQPKKKLRSFDD